MTGFLLFLTLAALPPDAQVVVAPSAAPATTLQPALADAGQWLPFFTLHFENDSLPFGQKGDDSYTQGLELRAQRKESWPRLDRVLRRFWTKSGNDVYERVGTFVVGQTLFTPHNIITYSPRVDDRPFAGFLYVSFESARVRDVKVTFENEAGQDVVLKPERLTLGVTVGVIGPLAGGRDVQSAFHVLRENRMAKGWLVSQLPNQPQLNFRVTREHIPLRVKDNFDLTLAEEATLGTTQAYAGVGATLRVGRALSSFPAGIIAYNAVGSDPKNFELSAQFGGRWRFMAHNAFIGGPIGKPTGLHTVRSLREWSAGVEVRWKHWRSSYLVVTRAQEFEPVPAGLPKSHRFIAVNVSRESWAGPEEPGDRFSRLSKGLRFNLRFGRADSTVVPDGPVSPARSLGASWGVERSLGSGRFAVGYEKTGLTREGGPPTTEPFHSDLFLLANVVALGWEPTKVSSRHKLQVRLGGGLATVKGQVTPDIGALREPEPVTVVEKGRSVLGGVRYSYRLGAPLSVTADVAAARLFVNKSLVRRAEFVSFTIGLQVHPWQRDARR